MNAVLKNGKETKNLNERLANTLLIVFGTSSAKASVSGENRGLAASAIAALLPALGQWTEIEITTDEEIITVKSDGIAKTLKMVNEAYTRMEAVRAELEPHEVQYRTTRQAYKLNPSDGKRGRKAIDPATRYAVGGDLFA